MERSRASGALRVAEGVVDVVLFGGVLLVLLGAGVLVFGEAEDVTVPVRVALPISDIQGIPPDGFAGLQVSGQIHATATIDDPSPLEVVLGTVLAIGQLPVVLVAMWLLRGLLASVRRGEPFEARSVRRLRLMGGVLLFGGLLVEIVDTQVRKELWERLPPNDYLNVGVAGFAWPVGFMAAGLLAYVLAEIFARGVVLREDVEATI